jgi:hypothetical protein
VRKGANATHIRALLQVFKVQPNGPSPQAKPPAAEVGTTQEVAGKGRSRFEWFDVTDRDRPPQYAGTPLMAGNHSESNDHDRRKAAIVRLAARIGIALCRAEYRPLSETEWARLDRMRLELDALRKAGL